MASGWPEGPRVLVGVTTRPHRLREAESLVGREQDRAVKGAGAVCKFSPPLRRHSTPERRWSLEDVDLLPRAPYLAGHGTAKQPFGLWGFDNTPPRKTRKGEDAPGL